ncbi:MAG TPA: DUF4350 domain-containing protein [Steroidobacteraceae bacterium]|jgi:hypothetical protein
MKDRVLTLALAIAAFALFYTLLMPKPAARQEPVTRPVTTEKGPNGYLAMERWLAAEGVPTVSLRQRYGRLHELTDASNAPGKAGGTTGNLLISTAPHLYPLRNSEVGPLRDWVSAGNTLLVVAGLSDTPDWSMGEGEDPEFMDHMRSMTGLDFVQAPPPETAAVKPGDKAGAAATPGSQEQKAGKESQPKAAPPIVAIAARQKLVDPLRFQAVPNGSHPLLAGVKSVAALSEYPASQWRATSNSADLILELTRDAKSEEPTLWLLRYGNGQIIVSAYGSVFTNKLLDKQDNARLLANIVKWSLRPGGKVIVDDAHQGLVAFYDAKAFFGDKRLHWSLLWLVGLWLVFVLGPQRLRVAASGWHPVDITSFVRASGGFMARVLRPSVAGQQLFTNFFNDVRRRVGLPVDGAPVWDWMNAHRALPEAEMDRLRELHGKVLRGRRVDLPALQTLLVEARGALW